MNDHELLQRITVEPGKRGGRPCVRGIRITVSDVVGLLAEGLTIESVLQQMPDLDADDVRACLLYASRYLDHPKLVAV